MGSSAGRSPSGMNSPTLLAKLWVEHAGSRVPKDLTTPRTWLTSAVRARTSASRDRSRRARPEHPRPDARSGRATRGRAAQVVPGTVRPRGRSCGPSRKSTEVSEGWRRSPHGRVPRAIGLPRPNACPPPGRSAPARPRRNEISAPRTSSRHVPRPAPHHRRRDCTCGCSDRPDPNPRLPLEYGYHSYWPTSVSWASSPLIDWDRSFDFRSRNGGWPSHLNLLRLVVVPWLNARKPHARGVLPFFSDPLVPTRRARHSPASHSRDPARDSS